MKLKKTLQRLFIPQELTENASVLIEGAQHHYLFHVLRLAAGAKLLIFNGKHGEWLCEIESASKKLITLKMLEQTRQQTPLPNIKYAFAPLKKERLDYMVQKAVEMGVASLQPIITEYTQNSKLSADKIHAYIIEAAEQCGILALPVFEKEISLDEFIKSLNDATLIFCDEDAPLNNPLEALKGVLNPVVLIGPEGGFSPEERIKLLVVKNAIRLSLGANILRADTAAVAALALVKASLFVS